MWNESFTSAPQLKRDPLDGAYGTLQPPMSFDQALALADPEDTVDALADVLWQRVDSDWSALSSAERVVFGVWSLKVEVFNGGFAQFFFNAVGEATPQIVDALQQVGSPKAAEIVETAHRLALGGVSLSDWRARQARIDGLSSVEREQLQDLSDQLEDVLKDIMAGTRAFAVAHREEFHDDPVE